MDGTFILASLENIQKYIQLQKHLFLNQALNSSLGFHHYRNVFFMHVGHSNLQKSVHISLSH